MIGILSYNAGNRTSVAKALQRLCIPTKQVASCDELSRVDGLIFPGAGAAPSAMNDLRERGLIDALRGYRKPFLGLCLGMQLLFDRSEEGDTECLGIVRGAVRRLPDGVLRPHIGWNRLDTGEYVYFIHEYACFPADPAATTMSVRHGAAFCAGLRLGNFFGLQWHPEKSGRAGDYYLKSFAQLCK
ncbi:MAG: imidazole glycerol phosphate synthase subunit HisH [Pirellulaceae bacterium]|nr:imidazole glycerol phosphate synthase subunit HisH [Pirellulaceae bacterium]